MFSNCPLLSAVGMGYRLSSSPASPTWASSVEDTSPLAWWRLGESNGTVAVDTSGNGYDGTYSGGYTLGVQSVVSGDTAVGFDGTGYIQIPAGLTIPAGSPITIAFWAYVNKADISTWREAFSIGNREQPSRCTAAVPYTDSVIYWDYGDATEGSGRVSASYADYYGKWTFVVLEGSNGKHAIYLDGVCVATNSGTGVPTLDLNGGRIASWAYYDVNFKGKIDEFIVWGRLLSDTEITDLYNIIADPWAASWVAAMECTNPAAWWRLGESAGTTAADASGNNYNGTYSGVLTLGQTGAVAGDTSVAFNGGFVSAPDVEALRITTAFTMQAWVKPTTDKQTYIVTRDQLLSPWHQAAIIYGYVSGTVELYGGGYVGDNPRVGTQITIPLNEWSLIHYVYNGITVKGYLNGEPVLSVAKAFSMPGEELDGWYLGAANSAGDGNLVGSLDEVAIWTRAISPTEIARIYATV